MTSSSSGGVPAEKEPGFLHSSAKKSSRVRLGVALWITILVLAAIRFFTPIHYYPHGHVPMGPETVRVGYYLYAQGEWANPYICLKTGPSAHVAPVFPLMLAGLYHLFGDGGKGALAFQIAEALIVTLEVAILPLVARELGMNIMVGFIASILAILGMGRDWKLEGNFVALLLMIITILACKYLRRLDIPPDTHVNRTGKMQPLLRSPVALATAIGLLWGIVLLTSPSSGLVWLSWLLLGGWYSYRRGVKRAWLLAFLVPLIMITPWAVRNYRVLHGLVPVRSNLGIELMVANNPCATYSLLGNEVNGCYWALHPNTSQQEARMVKDLGEVQYNRLKLRQTLEWIRANPGTFWRLTRQRILYFWFPTETGKFTDTLRDFQHHTSPWIVYLLTLLSIPGLVMLWRTSRYAAVICISFLALYPAIYYLVAFEYRYRYPIIWVSFLLGSLTIWQFLIWARDSLLARRAWPRWLSSSGLTSSAGR